MPAIISFSDWPQWVRPSNGECSRFHTTDAQTEQALTAKTEVQVPATARWEQIPLDSVLNGRHPHDLSTGISFTAPEHLFAAAFHRWLLDVADVWKRTTQGARNHPGRTCRRHRTRTAMWLQARACHSGGWTGRRTSPSRRVGIIGPNKSPFPSTKRVTPCGSCCAARRTRWKSAIANAELRLKYADSVVEKLALVPPFNFWTLCPFGGVDYEYGRDGFSLPKVPPDHGATREKLPRR